MDAKNEVLTKLQSIVYRLKQSRVAISFEDISQLNLGDEQKGYIAEILRLTRDDASEMPSSQIADQILRLGVNEIDLEEITTNINIMIDGKRPKVDTQFVTNQFNFFSDPKAQQMPWVVDQKHDLTTKIRLLCSRQVRDISLQDDFDLYVPSLAAHSRNSREFLDLSVEVDKFLGGDKMVLLISAESGLGKTFFCQTIIKRKAELYQQGDPIPIFISLPSLRRLKTHLLQEALAHDGITEEEVKQLLANEKFILVLDAYDETMSFDNFITLNKLDELNIKMIVTCRRKYFAKYPNYKTCFVPYKMHNPVYSLFQEIFLMPFTRDKIERYITGYLHMKHVELEDEIERLGLSEDWLLPQTYIKWIDEMSGLKALSSQPFLLRILMKVLPDVVTQFQNIDDAEEQFEMTHAKLYDCFVKKWFQSQGERLVGINKATGSDFESDCMAFAKGLAKRMHQNNLTVVYYKEKSWMDSVFEDVAADDMAKWAIFFSDQKVKEDEGSEERCQARIRSRNASLLRKAGDYQWAFLHDSLRLYFVSLSIPGHELRPNFTEDEDLLQDEPAMQNAFK